jgi:hypothetical protein
MLSCGFANCGGTNTTVSLNENIYAAAYISNSAVGGGGGPFLFIAIRHLRRPAFRNNSPAAALKAQPPVKRPRFTRAAGALIVLSAETQPLQSYSEIGRVRPSLAFLDRQK